MRRTKRISGLGVLAALVLVTSCESFLDPSPSDVLTPENFYRTSSDAVAATNAVYESTKWSYWLGFWYISDIAIDDIMAAARAVGRLQPHTGGLVPHQHKRHTLRSATAAVRRHARRASLNTGD